jgi:hypothetical protein
LLPSSAWILQITAELIFEVISVFFRLVHSKIAKLGEAGFKLVGPQFDSGLHWQTSPTSGLMEGFFNPAIKG